MNYSQPLRKPGIIEGSVRCFNLGLLGLVPVLGIPAALMALRHYRRIKLGRGAIRTAADRHLFWGSQFAGYGLFLISPLAVLAAVAAWLAHGINGP